MKRLFLLAFLVFAAVTVTFAKGMADKITVITPDGQTLNMTGRALVEPLSMAMLEKFPDSIPEPHVTGTGYELTRMFRDVTTYRIFDRVRYYPAGAKGYVFYIGLDNGWSEYDGKWFEASQGGVEAMNKIIASLKPLALRGRLNVWLD